MTLVAGTKLEPYEVLAPLGSGGMGEVYRARDSRLGREVHGFLRYLKVDPRFGEIQSDPRFQRVLRRIGLAG